MTESLIDSRLCRYDRQLLRDARLQESVRRSGYAVLPQSVRPEVVLALRSVAADCIERLGPSFGDEFLSVGRIGDPSLRSEVTSRAGALLLPELEPLFVDGATLLGTALQLKPPSASSALNPHQDASLVDETTELGLYAWVALEDTSAENGGLRVVPGSHRIRNRQRTLNIPWQFEPYRDILDQRCVQLNVPAGGIVIFDAATVHASGPNRTGGIRVAANSFVTHADVGLVHYFADDSTTPGTIEAYGIDVSFFLEDDIMERPRAPHRFLGERPQHRISLAESEFAEVCDVVAAEADGAIV